MKHDYLLILLDRRTRRQKKQHISQSEDTAALPVINFWKVKSNKPQTQINF